MYQASLLDMLSAPATAGLAGVMPAVRACMNRVAAKYPEGRKMLVDAINSAAQREAVSLTSGGGKTIKQDQLNKWLQSGEQGHAPTFEAILCFCLATNDYTPLMPVFRQFGLVLIPASDVRFLEYGKTCDALKKARTQKKKLEANL